MEGSGQTTTGTLLLDVHPREGKNLDIASDGVPSNIASGRLRATKFPSGILHLQTTDNVPTRGVQ